MEFQSKNLSSLLNSNKSIESYLSECTEYEKSNILEEAYNVDEGFGDWLKDKWQGFKHSVSSFTGHGNLQRHGKVFGGEDGGERGEAIDAQMASTESALKDNQIVGKFFQTLKDTYVTNKNGKVIKDYPNIRNESEFQNSTIEMAKLYDSIKAAALGNKQNGQPATIPIQQANVLIRQIRTYIDGLSKQLSDMYQYMTESDLKNYLFEQDEQQQDQGPLKGDYGKTDVMKAHSDYSVPKRLLKWGSILMAAGAAANGASSWMQQLEKWVPQNYDKWVKITQTITNPTDVTSNAHSVWGVWTDTGNQLGTLAPQGGVIKQMGDYQRIAEVLGGGNIPNGVRLMAQSMVTQNGLPKEAVEEMVNVISKANPSDPAGNFANAAAKFGAKNLFRIYKAGTKIHSQGLPQQITKQTKEVWTGMVQTTAGMTGGALALQIAGNALTGAGIALVAGAAVSALMKYKGSKSSRAQLLQVCKDTFKDLNESEIEIPMKKDGGDGGDKNILKPFKGSDGGATSGEDTTNNSSGGGGGFRGGSRQGYGREEVITSRDFIKQMTDLLVAKAGPTNPSARPGTPRTSQMDPSQANKIARQLKAEIDALKGIGGNTRDVIEDPRTITEARVQRSSGVVTRTAIENLITRFLAKGSNLPTPLSRQDLTKAIELAMNYSGAPKERESLRGGSTREDPINKKAFEGPIGNKIVGHIIVEMTGLKDREGKIKYPNMRLQRSEYENLIKKVLETLVNGNAILKPRRLAEARIFVGNPKNSRWFKIALQIVQNDPLFKATEKQQKPSQDTQNTMNTLHSRPLAGTDTLDEVAMAPGNRKIKPNPAQAVPFTEDLMKILIQNSLLAESKNDGEDLIFERWGKLAGILND